MQLLGFFRWFRSQLAAGYHLGDARLSLVIVWLRLPLGIILYLAALRQINPNLLRSRRDRRAAGPWAKPAIIWPNVMPVTLLILVLTLRGIIFDSFDIAFDDDQGGPLNSTDILAVYIYDLAFAQLRLGYASALSTVLFVIVTVLALIFNPPRRRRPMEITYECRTPLAPPLPHLDA